MRTVALVVVAAGLVGGCQSTPTGAALPRAVCNGPAGIGSFVCAGGAHPACADMTSTDWMCEGTLGTNLHGTCATGTLPVVCVTEDAGSGVDAR